MSGILHVVTDVSIVAKAIPTEEGNFAGAALAVKNVNYIRETARVILPDLPH